MGQQKQVKQGKGWGEISSTYFYKTWNWGKEGGVSIDLSLLRLCALSLCLSLSLELTIFFSLLAGRDDDCQAHLLD